MHGGEYEKIEKESHRLEDESSAAVLSGALKLNYAIQQKSSCNLCNSISKL
jgi:hypothetical protein